MRIKIFQMESSDRTYGKKFFGIPKDGVDPSLYKNVYYGDVEAESLEEVYSIFNDNRPYTFHGHSLSVSDIVQVCNENEDLVTPNGFYFVQDIGFEKIDFDASKAQEQEGMRVVYVTPNNTPLDIRIGTDLRDLQNAVGGLIQPLYNEDGTIMVGNDEAKLIGMKGNRHLDNGGIIAGPFFICGDGGEEFRSLTDEEVEKYMQKYAEPEEISDQEVAGDMGFRIIGF